jgi:uncharacterized membrane protein
LDGGEGISGLAEAALIATALGCGLIAGVFFAFSTFVMPALGRLEPSQGVAAMHSINVKAVTPVFMTALFGTAVACLVLSAWAAISPDELPSAEVFAASAIYLIGAIGVTMAANVPRNNRLAGLRADGPEAVAYWPEYLRGWTWWNHVRTVASLAAAVVLLAGL